MDQADLLLHRARVITMDPGWPHAEFVAIKDDRVLAVGNRDDLPALTGAATRLIDCGGNTVLPGFNDAHCHPLALASSLLSADCSPRAVVDIAGIQQRIRRRAERAPQGEWLRASGYDWFHLREKRPPNRWELDEASPGHPVFLLHATGQECVLNSLGLRLAGITRDTPDSPGGRVHRDPETGEPSGVIAGRDERVKRAIPVLSEGELEEGIKLVNREYLSVGVTSLQDTSWTNGLRHWQAWQRLVDREIVSPRVAMLAGADSVEEFRRAGLATGSGDSRLKVGGVKLALDESTGCLDPPQEELSNIAIRTVEAGFQVAFHVSDVGMLRTALAAIEAVNERVPGAVRRFRLEHCAVCPAGLMPGVRASRAMVVTQPSFLYSLGQRYEGSDAARQSRWLYPIGSLQRLGVGVAFSSDAPLATSNPLAGILAAVTRQTEGGRQLAPAERVTVPEALRMYTLAGACASSEEQVKGSLAPGKLADVVVLSGDITRLEPEQIAELIVVRTIIGGKTVWEH
ncbi:MAG: amidohydrolase [Chloroflexi bacterium]|nr:amidohydrolase [Chloroflexota bacterium]